MQNHNTQSKKKLKQNREDKIFTWLVVINHNYLKSMEWNLELHNLNFTNPSQNFNNNSSKPKPYKFLLLQK